MSQKRLDELSQEYRRSESMSIRQVTEIWFALSFAQEIGQDLFASYVRGNIKI